MRHLIALLLTPVLCVLVLWLNPPLPASGQGDSDIPTARPDPVPSVQGMTFVPAGYFTMGSDVHDLRRIAEVDEWPQRQVWVDDYYIDIHEVTNAQYKRFVDSLHIDPPPRWIDNNYGIGEDGLPVVSVTWEEALAYARFVGKRLPTEPEWEKAARGTDARRFPWGDEFDGDRANNSDHLMPIMSFPEGVSLYGCFDMAGNAAEWVDAYYEAYPRSQDDVLPSDLPDRREEFSTDKRVYRGGSWNSFAKFLRCANRESTQQDKRWVYVGFRCAMDPPWRSAR
jgi:formylglycine-generating enzyme required for sulfatase activity